jgi:hypothetical protein
MRRGRLPSIAAAVLIVGVAAVVGAACSSSSGRSTAPDVTICNAKGTAQADADLPAVSRILVAIDALEAKLGGPQQYFEVNATAKVVNLFVALNGATIAQAWLYADGTLTSKAGQKASGGTFTRAELDFQPDKVLVTVRQQIPDAILESFYVNGDGKGHVQYGVLTSAQCGGGLDVVVGATGAVKSVNPVQ